MIVTSVLFSRGVIHGVDQVGEVDLTLSPVPVGTSTPQFLLGQTIHFTSTLQFPNEISTLTSVTLQILDGPQTLSVQIPLSPGTFDLSA